MSKQYKYIRAENIENYPNWDLIQIIPRANANCYTMCIICSDDTLQKEVESYTNTIKQQQAEIERLKAVAVAELDTIHKLGDDFEILLETAEEHIAIISHQKAEIERLKSVIKEILDD